MKYIFSAQRGCSSYLRGLSSVYLLLSNGVVAVWEPLSEPEPDLPQDPGAAPSPGQSAHLQSGQHAEDQPETLQTRPGLPRQEPAPLHQQRPGQLRSTDDLVI